MAKLLALIVKAFYGRNNGTASLIIKIVLAFMVAFGSLGSTNIFLNFFSNDNIKYLVIGLGLFCGIIVIFFSGARLYFRKWLAGIKTPHDAKLQSTTLTARFYYRLYSGSILTKYLKKNLKDRNSNGVEASKAETITELFLISQQNKLAVAKRYAMSGLCLTMFSAVFFGTPFEFNLVFFGLFFLVQVKEEILIYRVNKGYFGSTTREAMMLIEFIGEQKDDSDMNSGGRRKQVFKPLVEDSEKVPGIGSLENFR